MFLEQKTLKKSVINTITIVSRLHSKMQQNLPLLNVVIYTNISGVEITKMTAISTNISRAKNTDKVSDLYNKNTRQIARQNAVKFVPSESNFYITFLEQKSLKKSVTSKFTENVSTLHFSEICWTFAGKKRTLFFRYFLLAKGLQCRKGCCKLLKRLFSLQENPVRRSRLLVPAMSKVHARHRK